MKTITWSPALLTVSSIEEKKFGDEHLVEFVEITGTVRKLLMYPGYCNLTDPPTVKGTATKLEKGVGFQFITGLIIIVPEGMVEFL
jgi:hypothetical protein